MGKLARMKLQYFGHVTRGSAGNLALTVLEGSIDGLRHQGRPTRQWMDDIEEWSGCSYIQLHWSLSQDRDQWRRKTIEWSSAVANRHDGGRLVSEWVKVVWSAILATAWLLVLRYAPPNVDLIMFSHSGKPTGIVIIYMVIYLVWLRRVALIRWGLEAWRRYSMNKPIYPVLETVDTSTVKCLFVSVCSIDQQPALRKRISEHPDFFDVWSFSMIL